MCIAVPGKVVEIDGNEALVEFEGVKRKIRIDFLDEVEVGDYVLNHVGQAIQKLPEEEAKERIKLFKEYLDSFEGKQNA
ncbi:HypC/HybG/HupF family hydrogenase formation chaperone [Methanonatronarchaeum sp. AMET6-2]|uniref:HypC/HybG/HupF family hydrogenase formation chaperone n=1 Tax=Methanonatronarchaeum sp. AMET6-2 TaxID=2933293 RepID=UPI0012212889|nr:HypC/HybG/HupF family hydrogenase formation chaperone [Methanonatronarchaeum sp. AMET6-2]RZN60961.1 MAG: HypC/HybG/HupF family hydrogenase formation chaperone [Methanonatronarchaeia archaeon]UOY10655.1 HypC/HybG/HupF family hydrogenase formation chaperone [Methanonatronarchaeum sp. AMET6-2]